VSELGLSESDGGEKKGSARFTIKEKKYTYMGVRKRLKNRRKRAIFPLDIGIVQHFVLIKLTISN